VGGFALLGEILEGLNAERDRSGMTRLEWSVDSFILFIHKLHSLEMRYSGSGYLNAVLFSQRAGTFGDWALSEVDRLAKDCERRRLQ